MPVFAVRYRELTSTPFFSEVTGTFQNASPYDFRTVTLNVVLRDASGSVLAFNRTEMNTVLAGEYRDFILRFPNAFPGEVVDVDVEPDVDFFRDENFVGQYRFSERYQELR